MKGRRWLFFCEFFAIRESLKDEVFVYLCDGAVGEGSQPLCKQFDPRKGELPLLTTESREHRNRATRVACSGQCLHSQL
jgi:hypothetical protein